MIDPSSRPIVNPMILRNVTLAVMITVILIAVFAHAPIPQDPAYHAFADRRTFLGIPNGLNVLSNLPFAVVGIFGLIVIWRRLMWPYLVFFVAAILTAAGSAYYHLAPDNYRLVWDRLPMAVGFMALLTAVIAERIGVEIARPLFVPLILLGALSVFYWYWTDDLRSYIAVQFGSLLMILLVLALYPARYSGTAYLVAGLAAYGAAKWFEIADARIFEIGHVVSGHTLKHLFAAAGIACVAVMLRARSQNILRTSP